MRVSLMIEMLRRTPQTANAAVVQVPLVTSKKEEKK